jgi:hypothetical protein
MSREREAVLLPVHAGTAKRRLRAAVRSVVFTLALVSACLTMVGQEPGGADRLILAEAGAVVISGSATAGSRVVVTIGETSVETRADASGAWSVTWPAELEGGSHLVVIATTDESGATQMTERDLRVHVEGSLPRRPLVERQPAATLPPVVPNLDDFQAYTNRWMITPPADYELQVSPKGKWDPYNQHVLKGDKPMFGEDVFLSLTGISDTLFEARSLPTPSGPSADTPGSFLFFGEDGQAQVNQNLIFTADLFKGLTTFKPAEWRARATIVANYNYVQVGENLGVNIDVRKGTTRHDGFLGVQELFYEHKLADLSEAYDFVSIRAGVQTFSSDFRGFVFNDQNLGVRLFGNLASNRLQYNLAVFDRLEKDTNSGLNKIYERREQQVLVANVYRQDTFTKGYTTQLSIHYLHDEPSVKYDKNGFLVRPAPVGDFVPHEIDATYLGWAGLGKFGVWNVDHAFYYVFGKDSHNPIAGFDPLGGGVGGDGVTPGRESVDISATMAAIEVSRDYDWVRPRVAYFFASGDGDIFDRKARGFDAIFSNVNFLGGGFSFWNRMGIRLTGTGLGLTQRGSLLADLQSSKDEGQPEFVNPGVHIASVGLDLDLTPRWKAILTGNYIRLDDTAVIEGLLFQDGIRKEMGFDFSVGLRYRPFFSNNIVVLGGVAAFAPGSGWKDIYEDDGMLFHAFTNVTLQF